MTAENIRGRPPIGAGLPDYMLTSFLPTFKSSATGHHDLPKNRQLFYCQVIFHRHYTGNPAGDLSGLFSALRRINKTA